MCSDLLFLSGDCAGFYRLLSSLFRVGYPHATPLMEALPAPLAALTQTAAAEICQRIAGGLQPTSHGILGWCPLTPHLALCCFLELSLDKQKFQSSSRSILYPDQIGTGIEIKAGEDSSAPCSLLQIR